MRKSCTYCGRIHDVMYKCPQSQKKRYRKKEYDYDKYRNTIEWQSKRAEIQERDLHMCQVCVRGLFDYGARRYNSENTSVHHIIPLKDNYELRDINTNLITLCDCHHKMADRGEISAETLRTIAFEQENIPPAVAEKLCGGFLQETGGKIVQNIPKMKI